MESEKFDPKQDVAGIYLGRLQGVAVREGQESNSSGQTKKFGPRPRIATTPPSGN